MTELKDELKVRPGEGAVEYAERVDARLKQHHEQTGESIHSMAMLPDENPGETLERMKVLQEADRIREADRGRKQARDKKTSTSSASGAAKDTSSEAAAQKSSRSFRLKSQERDVQRAVSAFKEAEKKLYRNDGSKVYGDEEHAERLGRLREEFSEKIGKVVSEVEEDAREYEQEAHSYAYTDPIKGLSSLERARLDSSRPLVAEDCERLSVEELTQRIEAVSAGADRVAKVLHARYGSYRVRSIEERRDREFQAGTSRPGSSAEAERLSSLRTALRGLEEQTENSKVEERRKAAQEAATRSRQLVREARRRQVKLDGTAEIARQRQAEITRAAL